MLLILGSLWRIDPGPGAEARAGRPPLSHLPDAVKLADCLTHWEVAQTATSIME